VSEYGLTPPLDALYVILETVVFFRQYKVSKTSTI